MAILTNISPIPPSTIIITIIIIINIIFFDIIYNIINRTINYQPNHQLPTQPSTTNPTINYQPNHQLPTQPSTTNPTINYQPNHQLPTQPSGVYRHHRFIRRGSKHHAWGCHCRRRFRRLLQLAPGSSTCTPVERTGSCGFYSAFHPFS